MRLQGKKLSAKAEAAGVDSDALAAAIERTGLEGNRASRAIGNWMDGRDHPRCKASDIAKLAEVLDCPPKDICCFQSQVRHHRGSTQKARLLADLVRGKSVAQAESILSFSTKRAAVNMKKALMAAYADAEQAGANDPETLMITDCRVDEGPHIKRFQPKDRGRAHPILKRTSHITIGVEERS